MSVILLLEQQGGETVGVRFDTAEQARAWEDEHELTAVGLARIVSRTVALRAS